MKSHIDDYVLALCAEIASVGMRASEPIDVVTVYFGGGTPSLLSPQQVGTILEAIHTYFNVDSPEITFEANPDDLTSAYLEALLAIGVNRLSMGVQSMHGPDLRMFHRRHDAYQVTEAFHAARRAGVTNISLDLIYGAPGQTMASWSTTLEATLALEPEHLSLYSLGIEDGTLLAKQINTGTLTKLDDDTIADMYELAADVLEAAGYEHYEISNWAKPGMACHHNLRYWRRRSYLGLGAGAYGFWEPYRYKVIDSPLAYIDAIRDSKQIPSFPMSAAVDEESIESLTPNEAQSEAIILGLRLLKEGICFECFQTQFATDLRKLYKYEIQQLHDRGLLVVADDRMLLSKEAWFISNSVLVNFV